MAMPLSFGKKKFIKKTVGPLPPSPPPVLMARPLFFRPLPLQNLHIYACITLLKFASAGILGNV